MTVNEILAVDKLVLVKILAAKKRKANPRKSKTTKLNSFIDVFGGMAGIDAPGQDGSINPTAA